MKKGRALAVVSAATLLAGSAQSALPIVADAAGAKLDYAKALQMSLYFYECQQAGKLPEWNRVEWKGDSTVNDDVDGGWYDAGDHVKFNLPMAYSASMLAWGLYEYGDAVESCGEMTNYVNNLTWVLDYFVRCDLGDSVIYQVGNGQEDHTWWGPVELLEYGMADQGNSSKRSHLEGRDCSAVTAQMGAALTAGYCALQGKVDSAKLEGYLKHAKNFLKMADEDRSDDTYNGSDAQGFYASRQFYDDLFFLCNWLYIATKDSAYLKQAESYIPDLGHELGQGDTLKYSWCHCWDDVQQGATLLYAINTGDEAWKAQFIRHMDYWRTSKDVVPGGLIYVQNWGCLRHANAFAFTCAVGCDRLLKPGDAHYDEYVKLYETQVNFALGDNPNNQCYVVGYADNSPKCVHHRTAHGSWKNAEKTPTLNRHILYGALAGGPNQDGSYDDDRGNYVNNEVATDYNAGFTAMLCKMISVYGGKSDPSFPPPEPREDELFVEAKGTHDAGGSSLSLKITNHTAWPARIVDNVSFRYYMDLSEIIDAGIDPTSIEIRCDRDQSAMYSGEGVKTAEISKPQKYSDNIYYVEITFPDGRAFIPISEGRHQCEIMLALVYPNYGKGWDASNDYSAKGMDEDTNTKTPYIPVYENGVLISGIEPDGTVGKGSISANPPANGAPPIETVINFTTTTLPTSSTSTSTTTKTTDDTSFQGGETANWGDVDCNDSLDVRDAVLLARAVADDATLKENEITAQGKINADVTHDGVTAIDDLAKLLNYLCGKITRADLAA